MAATMTKKKKKKLPAPGDTAQQIKDLNGQYKAYLSLIRCTKTDLTDDAGFERRKKHLEDGIANQQKMLADLIERRANGPKIIKDAAKRCQQIKKQINALENIKGIAKLLEMQAQLHALQEDSDDEVDE